MTKTSIFKITGLILLVVAFAGCNNLKKMANNFNSVSYEVTPEVLETKGGSVEFTVTGNIPPKYFNKKAAVFFQPVLKFDGQDMELTPMTLIGENVDGEGTKVNYENGGTFTYTEQFDFVPEMRASELMVNMVAFLPKEPVAQGMSMADAMKMKKAVNLGEVKIADGVIATSLRMLVADEVMEASEDGMQVDSQFAVDMLELAPHGYEKVTIVSEMATIYYQKNLHFFNKNLEWNKKKDMPGQLENLSNFVRKGWEIKDVEIDGWASPEGEETFNEGLSERRGNTAKTVVFKNLKKLVRENDSKVTYEDPNDLNLKLVGHGPDWNGFMEAVKGSSIKDKQPILNVVKSSRPEQREEEIRNMINIYPELEESILPSLRRATVMVNCFEPKKTDEEIARLATTNPRELNEKELLYAGTLTDNWNTQYKIYKSATTQFPDSWKGFNNAAYVALKLGETDAAIEYLEKAKNLNSNNGAIANNLGVAYAVKEEYAQAEKNFLNANKMGVDNNYNLGLIDLEKGNYKSAISKFAGVKCNYHVALAQIMVENYKLAEEQLECARKNGGTYYLMAIVGARTNNKSMAMQNLEKAIKTDSKYKKCATVDREFLDYFEDSEYQALIK